MQAAVDLIDLALLYLYTETHESLGYADLESYDLPDSLGAGVHVGATSHKLPKMTTLSFTLSQVLSSLRAANTPAGLERLSRISDARRGILGSFDTFDCVMYPEN